MVSVFSIALYILSIIFVFRGFSSNFLNKFALCLGGIALIYFLYCVLLECRERWLRNEIVKLESGEYASDLYNTLLKIKSLHKSVLVSMERCNLKGFEKTENLRYHSMWENYFFTWLLSENDRIYHFSQHEKNEFDSYAMRKRFNEMHKLHQQLLTEFEEEEEFIQILNIHFTSLKKDYNNLLNAK